MPLFRKKPPKRLTLEAQLRTLAANGINLNPGRTVDDLLISFPRERFESLPYELLITMLGSEVESRPCGRHFTDCIYTFDAECIEDHGDYRAQLRPLTRIAGGDLPIEDIRDAIDVEAGTARIEFTLDGRPHKFEPTIYDDWFDCQVISWLDTLLTSRDSTRRYFILDNSGDQNLVVLCTTPHLITKLVKATGLQFHRTN